MNYGFRLVVFALRLAKKKLGLLRATVLRTDSGGQESTPSPITIGTGP